MASNSTNLDVNVNIHDDQVAPSEEKFKSLRRQIRETLVELQALTDAGDTQGKKFSELNLKLAELRTEQEQVNNKTQALTSTFSLMGGAVGEFGDKAEVGIQALKTISSFTLKDIQNQFMVVGQELKTFIGKIVDASGITKAYAATNAYLAESFVAVGVSEEAAAVGAKAFSAAIIATGIGALIIALALVYQNWDKIRDSLEGVTAATKTLDAETEKVGKSSKASAGDFDALAEKVKLATTNLYLQAEAVKEYNTKFGETLGKITNFIELQRKMTGEEFTNYKNYLIARAKAEADANILTELYRKQEQDKIQEEIEKKQIVETQQRNAASGVVLSESYKNALRGEVIAKYKEINEETENQIVEAKKLLDKNALAQANAGTVAKIKPEETPEEKKVREAKEAAAKKYAADTIAIQKKIKDEDDKAIANSLKDREKEEQQVKNHFKVLIDEATKLKVSTVSLKNDEKIALAEVTKKWDELDKKKKEEQDKKDLEMSKQAAQTNLQNTKEYLTKQSAELQKSYGDDYETKVQYYEDNKKLLENQIKDLDTFLENGYITQQQYDALKEQNRKDRIANEKKEAVTVEGIITKSYDNRETLIKEKFGRFAVFQKAYWDAEKASLQKSVDDNEKAYKAKQIDENTYLANKKKNADAAIKIDEGEQKSKELTLGVAADAFNNLATIAGKQTEAGKAFAVAGATISTYESATKAYDALSGIPVVGPFLGGLAAAAAVVAGLENVKQIMSVQTPNASGAPASPTVGKQGYADGGIIYGNSHAQGGVNINAQGGEAVMTRGAVSMFGPMLSMMNKAGGGTSFNKGIAGIRYDNPKSPSNPMSEQQIIKTYVVAQDMNAMNHKQARLKDLSTL